MHILKDGLVVFVGIILIVVMTVGSVHIMGGIEDQTTAIEVHIVALNEALSELDKAIAEKANIHCLYGAFPENGVFVAVYSGHGPPPPGMPAMYLCGDGLILRTAPPAGAIVDNPHTVPLPASGGLN